MTLVYWLYLISVSFSVDSGTIPKKPKLWTKDEQAENIPYRDPMDQTIHTENATFVESSAQRHTVLGGLQFPRKAGQPLDPSVKCDE